MSNSSKKIIYLLRKDLRIKNNPALQAATTNFKAAPVFIFDEKIISSCNEKTNSYWWLTNSLQTLNEEYKNLGTEINFYTGNSKKIIHELLEEASGICVNKTYEPHIDEFDEELKKWCEKNDKEFKSFPGYLLFEPAEILNKQKKPYAVFTAFWKSLSKDDYIKNDNHHIAKNFFNPEKKSEKLVAVRNEKLDSFWTPGEVAAKEKIKSFLTAKVKSYETDRDIPSKDGTSLISAHLHFGEITPSQILEEAIKEGVQRHFAKFYSELGWREFSYYLLHHNPQIRTKQFRELFTSKFKWNDSKKDFQKWCEGKTGFPLVDAGMRQLNAIGWVHNRVRMVVASFLVKNLMINWQEGAEYFFEKLVDADPANNFVAWQWVAGCGPDAAPYFRIFNPNLQADKFDPDYEYIKTWVPEFGTSKYTYAMVDFRESSKKFLAMLK